MKKPPARKRPRTPTAKKAGRPATSTELNQATAEEFEREGMGVAPKE